MFMGWKVKNGVTEIRKLVQGAFAAAALPDAGPNQGEKEKAKPIGGGSVEQAVLKLEDEYMDANKKGDCAFFEKNLSSEYIYIFGNGQMSTKAEAVNACKSGQMKYDTIDVKKDRKVQVYGNTAIVTSEAEVKGHRGVNSGHWHLPQDPRVREDEERPVAVGDLPGNKGRIGSYKGHPRPGSRFCAPVVAMGDHPLRPPDPESNFGLLAKRIYPETPSF